MVTADVDRQIILSQRARQGPRCDAPALPGLVDAASHVTPIGLVLADAEFDSEANHQHIRRDARSAQCDPRASARCPQWSLSQPDVP